MVTIGKIRGWRTRRTFWVAAILYALLIIAIFIAALSSLLNSSAYFSFERGLVDVPPIVSTLLKLLIILIIVGIIFSPLTILAIRWRYKDIFSKSEEADVAAISNARITVENQPSSSMTDSIRSTPRRVTPSIHKSPVNPRSGHIFVSYRRSDSADIAGRNYDRLGNREKSALRPISSDVFVQDNGALTGLPSVRGIELPDNRFLTFI